MNVDQDNTRKVIMLFAGFTGNPIHNTELGLDLFHTSTWTFMVK